ncbi:DUF4381 domain-containing protein [Phycobacter sp. K97]|uniref:DUF4381 domain-containing protein n=1 Tax=Phycobacter sedimenti TaxID=3133977 RepID=UPI0031204B41
MSGGAETRPDNLVDLIARLTPPQEPQPISMMPQTVGWAVIAGLFVVGGAYALWRWRTAYLENAYRRAALSALKEAGQDPTAIAEVLRRAALAAFPRRDIASLSGEDWLAFLDQTGGCTDFRHGPGRALAFAPYQSPGQQPEALPRIAAQWVRNHRMGDGR